ncbi:Hpt domain-containing protein [Streptomyces sp. NPDC048362]|uniref:Hpt domain-containing protein n=1 Tax=Streptomyces sp. NPDC048362 TaxID=3365539 RepID=UPI003715537E
MAEEPHRGEPVDRAVLQSLSDALGGADSLTEVIDAYLAGTPELVGLLASPDIAEVRRAAHSMKSGAQALGASMLAELAAEAERVARAGAPLRVELVGAVSDEYRRVAAQLAALRA